MRAESRDCYSCNTFAEEEINNDYPEYVDLIPDTVGDKITFDDSSEYSRKRRSAEEEKTSKCPSSFSFVFTGKLEFFEQADLFLPF